MAIVLNEKRNGFDFFTFLIFIFFFVVIIGGGYFLFFGATPGIEFVSPSILKSTNDIAGIDFDPSQVLNNKILKSLKPTGGLPTTGPIGRSNPLISF